MFIATAILIAVSSTPDSVVVYPSGAYIHRTATLTISGDTVIRFDDLPGGLDEASVRIESPSGVRISEVKIVQGYMREPSPRIKALEDTIKLYAEKIKAMGDEKDVLSAKEKYLASIEVGGPKIASQELVSGKVDAKSWQAGLDFLGSEMAKVKARRREIDKLLPALQDTLNAYQQKLYAEQEFVRTRKSVEVAVRATKGGSYRFGISYIVPYGAGWAPTYELRALPENEKVEIVFNALIWQKTGEDWRNVKTVLSTTRPRVRQAPPLDPWYVDIYEPYYGYYYDKSAPEATARLETGKAKEVEAGVYQELALPPVETGVSLLYPIRERLTIKTGEEPRKIMVTSDEFPAQFEFYAYPRLDLTAYLTGSFENSSDFHYLPGECLLYVGDEYTGKTYLPDFAPGQADTLAFGADERIKITREPLKELKSKAGIFGNKRKIELGYKLTVENYLKKGITLVVYEAIPLPKTKDITVSGVKIEPKPDNEDKDKKLYSWTLKMKALDKWEAKISFSVEWPKDKQVQGLY
ncbi:MAG: mucoidy inhibitor MuiA family protein [candidate division WOR-3 bacterium]